MDFLAEFSELKTLPNHIAATYSFFKLFSVDKDTQTLCWNSTTTPLEDEPLQEFRAFLKSIKRQLQEKQLKPSDCCRAMFFFYSKLLQYECFEQPTRQEILKWMEVCELIVV
jgi:TorA maturation chaperone TorD